MYLISKVLYQLTKKGESLAVDLKIKIHYKCEAQGGKYSFF